MFQMPLLLSQRFNYVLCKYYYFSVEDPADSFVMLRDYVDCINCSKLPSFAPEKLITGFSEEMRHEAQSKFKICKVS